jgi:hypothetical protein
MSTFMIRKIKYFLATLLLFCSFLLHAQQDPQFTHYMYNMSVINPAYATETPDIINRVINIKVLLIVIG